jgi:hypothetical protein
MYVLSTVPTYIQGYTSQYSDSTRYVIRLKMSKYRKIHVLHFDYRYQTCGINLFGTKLVQCIRYAFYMSSFLYYREEKKIRSAILEANSMCRWYQTICNGYPISDRYPAD